MVEDDSTAGLDKNSFTSRLVLDISIAAAVAAFAASMWGIPQAAELALSASIGLVVGLLAWLLLSVLRWLLEPLLPASRKQSSKKPSKNKTAPEVSIPPAKKKVTAKSPPQEREPELEQTSTSEDFSVTDADPRTVSIAAAPLPTPPFPKFWSEDLIETLEWSVFDNLCVAFWEAQGNAVVDHSKGSSEASSFFISAKNRPSSLIGVVQSRSSQANKASVIEMQNLLRLKQQSNLPIAIFMYAGRISNVVSSYCQSHGVRLFGSHNINKGLHAMSLEKQKELMKTLIRPDYMIPTCPNCRIKMVKRKRKDTGRIFWGCLSYPECRETIEYSPYF